MVCIVTYHNAPTHRYLLDAMHRDRKRVFIDTLRWNLPHEAERELDQFDNAHAKYLILHNPKTGDHLASLRLLETVRPHLMSEIFPFLCEAGVPHGPRIREVTRLCLSPRLRARDRLQARNALINGLVQYALWTGVEALTGVSDKNFLNQVLEAGWDCVPLGQLRLIDRAQVGAFQINITRNTLSTLNSSWRYEPANLLPLDINQPLAA